MVLSVLKDCKHTVYIFLVCTFSIPGKALTFISKEFGCFSVYVEGNADLEDIDYKYLRPGIFWLKFCFSRLCEERHFYSD